MVRGWLPWSSKQAYYGALPGQCKERDCYVQTYIAVDTRGRVQRCSNG